MLSWQTVRYLLVGVFTLGSYGESNRILAITTVCMYVLPVRLPFLDPKWPPMLGMAFLEPGLPTDTATGDMVLPLSVR